MGHSIFHLQRKITGNRFLRTGSVEEYHCEHLNNNVSDTRTFVHCDNTNDVRIKKIGKYIQKILRKSRLDDIMQA